MPLMGSMVGNMIMLLVDRICLARYSIDSLAASGPAIYTAMAIVGFFTAVVGFSRSCVAQAYGRSGQGEAAYQAAIGIVVGVAFAVILLLLAPLLEQIPFLSHRPPSVTRLESQFLYWSAYFGSAMTLNMAFSSYFNGIGKTRITLIAGLIGQAVVIFMTIGLVFGKFGLPELGMRGSAIGTLLGTLAILVCYLAYVPRDVWSNLKGVVLKRNGLTLTDVLPRIIKGFNLGISTGLSNLGNAAFIWIIAGLGAIALAANNVNLTVNYIGIIPLIGLSIGCSVLCGNALGENDYPQIPKIIFATLAIELTYVVVISFFQIATPGLLLDPFGLSDKPEEIRRASIATSQILWTYSLAFAFSMTGSAVLEAFGLTRFLFVTRLILMWVLSIPTIYMTTMRHVGNADFLPTSWVIGSAFEAIIGALYFWRIWFAVKHRQNAIVLAQART
ncbi:MATE family efflux transporter [Dyella sp. GSA-30]|uniref:MATE family efflux transporter n=1 Tax=Dyella sp. GSA-30 TaxID=2994496 RepID=UPI0031F2EA2C